MSAEEPRDSESIPGNARAGRWEPCFVDPWRGVAHFDGITIEADPITSARPDRVLPCIADEQVFFCRMLRHVLSGTRIRGKEGSRKALDLGTGSGVLGIAGAALGLEVTGLDFSQRALDYAAFNKKANDDTIGGRGTLELLPVKKGNAFADEWLDKGSCDYILLNPPFAPVHADWQAPSCVNAGPDGQDFFFRIVHRAGELLKPGGRLFAVHLMLTDEDGRPAVLDRLDPGDWESLTVFPAFPQEPLFALDEFRRQTWGRTDTDTASPGTHLCLAFLELRKRRGRGKSAVDFRFETQVPVAPPTNWQSRIAMHRAVLNSSPRLTPDSQKENGPPSDALLPAGAYFLDRTTPFLGVDTDDRAEATASDDSSIERSLLNWIQANDLIALAGTPERGQETGSYFDAIIIEAAPWYLSGPENLELRSSTSLVCSGKKEGPTTAALTAVLQCIQRINTDMRSIFRHPDQESYASDRWHTAIAAHFQFKAADVPRVTPSEDPNARPEKPTWITAGMLGAACRAEMLDSLKVRKDNPSTINFDECLHDALRDFTGALATQELVEPSQVTCYIAGVPLPPTHIGRLHVTSDEEKLTGIVYVYGWSSRSWSPAAESALIDLARVAALMHEESYANAAEQRLQQIWTESAYQDALETAQHELSYVVNSLKHGLPKEATELIRFSLGSHLVIAGPELDPILESLENSPTVALLSLWSDSFVVRKISKSANVDDDSIRQWRREAAELADPSVEILAPDALKWGRRATGPSSSDLKGKKALAHFHAGLVAAMSNAASFAAKARVDGTKCMVSFRISHEFLEVVSTYSYGSDSDLADLEFQDGRTELERKARDKKGTEWVLRYHAAQYDVSTSSPLLLVERRDASRMHDGEEGVRWTCRVPLPSTSDKEHAT